MDGTLVDSAAGVVRVWENLQRIYPTIDVQKVLSCKLTYYHFLYFSNYALTLAIHGARTVDSLKVHCGLTDPQELEVRVLV
jgi:GH25 family lysozyme M1 (1,4-beta-N-acetylmuramidase)